MSIESVWEIGDDQFDSPHKVAALVEDLWSKGSHETAFDLAEGLHWHCVDYHGGQWSERYAILSSLDYNPSPVSRGPDSEGSQYVYDRLADAI